MKILAALLILFGAALLVRSMQRTKKIFALLETSPHRAGWQFLTGMMIVFLLGYVLAVLLVFQGAVQFLTLLVGVIFLSGALFVNMVVRTGQQTIEDLDSTTVSKKIMEDIVHQRTQELDEAHSRLEKLDAAKSDFISIVSHEIRTPLTIIKGYSQILSRKPLLAEDEEAKNMFQGVLSGIERLQKVVGGVIDLNRIDNNTLHLEKMQVSLAETIECAAVEYDSAFRERSLTFMTRDLHDLPQMFIDQDLMCKVFHQLIVNAVKYTPDGGSIIISGKYIDEDEYSCVQLEIKDSGIGIAPQNQNVIFEKFFQTGPVTLHSSGETKFKGGGPGLGLAIAKGVVLAHGGKIWAESQGYDEETCPGSSFFVELPIEGADPQ